jgi:PAS domain S-box-containing protein
LIENETKYRTIAESLPQIIFEADESGKLSYINKIGLSMLDYTQEDFVKGINMMDMIAAEYKKKFFEDARKQIDGKDIYGNEYWAIKKSGKIFPIFAYTNKIVDEKYVFKGFRGIMLDISEGHKAQTEIKKLFNIIQQSADNVIIADSNGTIEYANPAFVKAIGYSFEEMSGKKFAMFHTEEFDERYFNELIKILSKGEVYRFIMKKRPSPPYWIPKGY